MGAITPTMPALTYTGTGGIFIQNNNGSNGITITGNINTGGSMNTASELATGNTFTVNLGNNTLTCGLFQVGSSSTGTLILNYNGATINCTSFDGYTYNTGTTTENRGNCTINCSGSFTEGSTHTIVGTQWTLHLTGSSSTLTTNGLTEGIIQFDSGSGHHITLGGNVSCTYFTLVSGTITYSGYTITQHVVCYGAIAGTAAIVSPEKVSVKALGAIAGTAAIVSPEKVSVKALGAIAGTASVVSVDKIQVRDYGMVAASGASLAQAKTAVRYFGINLASGAVLSQSKTGIRYYGINPVTGGIFSISKIAIADYGVIAATGAVIGASFVVVVPTSGKIFTAPITAKSVYIQEGTAYQKKQIWKWDGTNWIFIT
jgi:hypothetical protein